jgi:hypothetical protein
MAWRRGAPPRALPTPAEALNQEQDGWTLGREREVRTGGAGLEEESSAAPAGL